MKLRFRERLFKPILKSNLSVPDERLGGLAGRAGKYKTTPHNKAVVIPASVQSSRFIWSKWWPLSAESNVVLEPMSSTKSGPIKNDKAYPVDDPADAIAVEVVRWLLGNHVADKSTPPESATGARRPEKAWPKQINIVAIFQLLPVGIHLNMAPMD